ncbi:hypothetical protein [Streptomyces sp. 8K308]
MGLQREVAGVQRVQFRLGQVARERLGAGGAGDLVVPAQVRSVGGRWKSR